MIKSRNPPENFGDGSVSVRIAIEARAANLVRALKAAAPYLTETDIVGLTGFDGETVKNALGKKRNDLHPRWTERI